MTYVPHVRLTLSGDLPAGEQFSCNLSLVPQGDQWQTYLIGAWAGADIEGAVQYGLENYVDSAAAEDIAADCVAFWADDVTLVHPSAVLKRVKLASIGPDGTYGGNPVEVAVNQPGGFPLSNALMPNSVARKVTLHTNGDLGRVKGGFYLPGVTNYGFDLATQNFVDPVVSDCVGAVKTFLQNLENAPGFDAEGYRVVVASQGRHNANGTLRRPPTNHDVVGVSIGRRPDTQRRRTNKVPENRAAPQAI